MRTLFSASGILIGASLALVACTAQPETTATAPTREPAPVTATSPSVTPSADQCRASERQAWVGQPVDRLPAPPPGANWRMVCTTCGRTDDHRPDRLNIEFEESTRRIVKVSCG